MKGKVVGKRRVKLPGADSLMPGHLGIVALDAESYTRFSTVEQLRIVETLPTLLEESLVRAGLPAVWAGRKFPSHRGDGYSFGFDPSVMPQMIHPWLMELEGVLVALSADIPRIRLRVSLHIGPLPAEGLVTDGSGGPRNDAHRLLNVRPLKRILAEADPDATRVAAILSARCYEDAVQSGRTIHPGRFTEVAAIVEGKGFEQRAWMYLPAPSGNLLDRRIWEETTDSSSPEPEDPPRPSQPQAVNQVTHENLNHGFVYGDQSITHFG
jgi:hypothetical protein